MIVILKSYDLICHKYLTGSEVGRPPVERPDHVERPLDGAPDTRTVGERSAEAKAAQYLRYSAFSRTGLIEQLEFEGFSRAEAVYGTDAVGADWSEQAAKKAEQYLRYSAFSRSSLIDQLEFEGFTRAQAEYGVRMVGY